MVSTRKHEARTPMLAGEGTGFDNVNTLSGAETVVSYSKSLKGKFKGIPLNATPDEIAKAVDWCERTMNRAMRNRKAGARGWGEDTVSACLAYRLVRELAADVGVLR